MLGVGKLDERDVALPFVLRLVGHTGRARLGQHVRLGAAQQQHVTLHEQDIAVSKPQQQERRATMGSGSAYLDVLPQEAQVQVFVRDLGKA